MSRLHLTAACLAIVVTSACASRSTSLTDADREAIRTASQSYVKADEARDADAMMGFVAEGAVYMPSNAPMISGREAIRAFLKPHPWDKITAAPAEIEGHDGLAFERGSYTVLMQGKTYTGFYLDVWVRQADGAWKVTRKIWNSDKP